MMKNPDKNPRNINKLYSGGDFNLIFSRCCIVHIAICFSLSGMLSVLLAKINFFSFWLIAIFEKEMYARFPHGFML